MIMSFDWIFHALRDEKWKSVIFQAMHDTVKREIPFREIMRLMFDPESQIVTVIPFSETSIFHCKIIPISITYHAVKEIINGNLEKVNDNEIKELKVIE